MNATQKTLTALAAAAAFVSAVSIAQTPGGDSAGATAGPGNNSTLNATTPASPAATPDVNNNSATVDTSASPGTAPVQADRN